MSHFITKKLIAICFIDQISYFKVFILFKFILKLCGTTLFADLTHCTLRNHLIIKNGQQKKTRNFNIWFAIFTQICLKNLRWMLHIDCMQNYYLAFSINLSSFAIIFLLISVHYWEFLIISDLDKLAGFYC